MNQIFFYFAQRFFSSDSHSWLCLTLRCCGPDPPTQQMEKVSVKADTLSDTWRYFSKLPHMPCSHAVDTQNSILSSCKLHKSKKNSNILCECEQTIFFYQIHHFFKNSFSSNLMTNLAPNLQRFLFLKKPKALVGIFNNRDSLTGQILKWFSK